MGATDVGTRLGARFGPYELQSLIGVGGMGEVYRAYDTSREREVALKLLRTDISADPTFAARFRRESRIAARLREPHVIPVHDFGDIDGTLYIDMRLVEGASVKEVLRANGPMPPARAVSVIAQVAAALDAAHANDLVHRDIKPENVLLTPDDFAYLVDFGIAYGGGEASVTQTGLVIGSATYMAPERLRGKAGGPPSDVYSLACLFYECITGRAPYDSKDLRALMSDHMFADPPRPSAAHRGLNPAFDAVVAKGLAKEPADRFASAGELAKAATAVMHGRVAPPPMPVPRPVPPSTHQFPVDPRPAGTGYVSAPPPRPAPPKRKRGFSRTQTALLLGAISVFALAALLAIVVVFTGGSVDTAPSSQLAAPSTTTVTSTEPSASSTSTTTAPSTTSTSPPIAGLSGTDSGGFIDHAARCDFGSRLKAAIRTPTSLAVICENFIPGTYYYHGERLSDGANVKLNAVPAGDGFDAVNPADGAQYQVRPDQLTISSNGRIDSSERALEYGTE